MCPKIATSINTKHKDKTTFIPLLKGAYQLGIANTIEEIAHLWELAAPSHDEFLQVPYLSFIESRPPGDIHFKYLVFCKKNTPIGIAYCQISELKIREALTDPTLSAFRQKLNDTILKAADMNALFCGNILLTGEHGSYFCRETVDIKTESLLLKEGLEVVKNHCKKEGEHISLLLVKDLDAPRKIVLHPDLGKDYKEFSIQPKMILNLRPEWNAFEDYLAAMTSKYRVRAKRAFKKGKDLEKRELNIDLIKAGIEQKAGYINFARTALEIKSSVGAEPVNLFYLGKHTNSLKNTLFTPILAYFNPTIDWVQRKPFKELGSGQ